jgi:HNH endonuclease
MTNKIAKYRNAAASKQNWICYYCEKPMGGKGSPFYKLTSENNSNLSATAEHLLARQDGGPDSPDNIVATHKICNRRRHICKQPKLPKYHLMHVRRCVLRGGWFDENSSKLISRAIAGV